MRGLEDYPGTSCAMGMALEHFGRAEYGANETITYHTHGHFEFCLLESGSVDYRVDDRTYPVRPDDLIVTRPGEYHSMTGRGGDTPWVVAFINVRMMPTDELGDAFVSARVRVLPGCGGIRPAFDGILAEARGRGFGSALAVHALTAHLLVEIARKLRSAPPDPQPAPFSGAVYKAMQYMGANGTYSTGVDEVARAANISGSRLSHVFKAETGTTVREHLRAVLMERARRMLEDGSHTVTDIADRLGFPSVACFSAFFRMRQGMPPSAYARTRP